MSGTTLFFVLIGVGCVSTLPFRLVDWIERG